MPFFSSYSKKYQQLLCVVRSDLQCQPIVGENTDPVRKNDVFFLGKADVVHMLMVK